MKHNITIFALILALALLLTACDNGPVPQPTAQITAQPTSQPTAQSAPQATEQPTLTAQPTTLPTTPPTTPPTTGAVLGTPTVVDALPITPAPTTVEDNPSPTAVTGTSTGAEITALQALALLKPKALAWRSDVRLAILANTRPGQQTHLLGSALGDPNIFEPTPGGKGRNWTLIAVSPLRGALAVSADGTQVDLSAAGVVTNEMLGGFSGPNLTSLDLSTLNLSRLVDSDKLPAPASTKPTGTALFAPDGLGIGPLPTPQTGGRSPALAYQTFSTDPAQQNFTIFDASTGTIILDSAKP